MRCASKAAKSASARLCADAEAETTATDVSSVAEATHPVSPGDAGARHEDTHVFTEYELGVSHSPNTEEGSVSKAVLTKPPAKRGMDDAMRRSIFGSSDESDEPSPKRRRSKSQDSGAHSGVGSLINTNSQRGASPSIGTSQEERDRNVLRLALEKKAWMPLKSVMDRLSATTSDRYRTRLFDLSRIHHLDPSAKDYRAENEFFINAFFKHRWYSGNHKRDGPSLLQAWNAHIHTLEDVGRDVWNDKLIKARDKFE
uniref:ASX DEUBAD domain-containing protein n=1 Tax=Peronospora matthiolae TaxID=2874970 RepID=A0AAV1SZT8_9STRA